MTKLATLATTATLLLSACLALTPAHAAAPAPLPIDSGWQMQPAPAVRDTGAQISTTTYRATDWHNAIVPGTALTTLVADKTYPDPMYGENNRPNIIPETLCRQDYWYRTTFTIPPDYAGKKIWLNLDGINYSATIYLNGRELGAMRGAFMRGQFDITPHVTPGRPAALAIRVSPQPHPGTPHEHTLLSGIAPNGGVTALDGPTFLCTIGWDWIPAIRDRNTGIWRRVYLTATGPVRIKNPLVYSDIPLPDLTQADLTIEATLQNLTPQPQRGHLKARVNETEILIEQPVDLPPNTEKTLTLDPKKFPQLHIPNPKLWWPNGYGPQNLHTLKLTFETTDAGNGNANLLIGTPQTANQEIGAPRTTPAAISDTATVRFGIRKIQYHVPENDYLTLSVNGVPVYARGGNWGMDDALKRIPRDRLEAQIRLHAQANYTMIRNWVGQSTNEDLYTLCDQYGLLIWDEFFQPNPGDGPNPADLDTYMANVREKILRYRNHPSIALWCARNEGFPPKEIDDRLRALLAELEPTRLYQPSSTSGRGVRSGGPYRSGRSNHEFYDFDDTQYFKTEIGTVSIPTIESIQNMLDPKDWNAITDAWAQHDLARGASGGEEIRAIIEKRYGEIANLADFTRKAQLVNYESHRAMYEGRLAKMFAGSSGILMWMSHPAQPSFVWQIYHYDLEPHASYFAVKNACEMQHIMLNEKTNHIMVLNHRPTPIANATARIRVYNLDGTLVSDTTRPVNAPRTAFTDLGKLELPDPKKLSAIYFVKLTLTDAQQKQISENFYWHAADPKKPDDLRALDKLPAATLDVYATTIHPDDPDDKLLILVTLHNPTTTPALMAHLQLHRAKSGDRVLPAFYSDNYISLMPGESQTLTVEAAQSDLKDDTPLILVDGWNIAVKNTVYPHGYIGIPVPIALNQNAQPTHWPRTGLPIKPSPDVYMHPPSDHYAINCGGFDLPDGTFTGDICWQGGAHRKAITDKVDATGHKKVSDGTDKGITVDRTAPNTAPNYVYQSQRTGEFTYVLPMLPGAYTVRLHFVATNASAATGKNKFNVQINNRPALTDFDIYAAAGGKNKAITKDIPNIRPAPDGKIRIRFLPAPGSIGQPQVSAIEVLKEEIKN